nr:MAG TPA: hypothetical protein [Caudoviricetes sp.]
MLQRCLHCVAEVSALCCRGVCTVLQRCLHCVATRRVGLDIQGSTG